MAYYLVPMVETARFPTAPVGSLAASLMRRVPYGWGLVDENHIIVGDQALLHTDDTLTGPGVVEIGTDKTERVALATRRDLERFANDGRTYRATQTFADVVLDLLDQPSDRRVRTWGRLRAGKPTRRVPFHHRAIWLGPGGRGKNLFYVERVAAWHDTSTSQDNFNRSDRTLNGDTMSAGGKSWEDTSASTPFAIVSNQLSVLFPMGEGPGLLASADYDSDDLYAEVDLISHSDTNQFQGFGVIVGAADDAMTNGYMFYGTVDGGGDIFLEGLNAGGLANNTSFGSILGVHRIERSGSSVEGFINGVSVLGPVTNTGESSGVGFRRVGVHGYRFVGGSATFVADNFDGGDLSAGAATVDQEGFRFGLDDAAESAHTWKDAQDVNVTHPLGTNLLVRAILDAASDPASFSPALRYQKNGSGGYVAVPVGASLTTYNSPGQPTSATGTTVGTAASSWTINRPTAAAGDLVVFVLAWDDSTNTTSVSAPAGPNGEAAVSIAGPIASASTEMRMQAWYYIASGAWSSGTLVFTPNASETVRAAAWVAATAGNFDAADPIGWSGTAASAGTTESTVNSPTGTAEANDGNGRLVIAYGSDADAITAPASGTTTVDNTTGGGVGLCVVTRNTLVSNSESIAAIAATIASDSWASLAFVIKPDVDVTTHEVYVAASAHITAGGEATTARLTAPAGKTTSDFTTGRRWDDENGTDAIDIATDFYTEVEWCLRAQAPAVNADYFDFRVYNGASPLDTYGVTPRWTIGSPLAPPVLRSSRSAAMQAIYTR
jgi:hypothetical protein